MNEKQEKQEKRKWNTPKLRKIEVKNNTNDFDPDNPECIGS